MSAYRTTSDAGAAAEMLACADLLRRGYEVFRAVSPSASCDLIASMGGMFLRVQVRSARQTSTGSLSYCKDRVPNRCDSIAAVLPNGTIIYEPALP